MFVHVSSGNTDPTKLVRPTEQISSTLVDASRSKMYTFNKWNVGKGWNGRPEWKADSEIKGN
jgi:hypothetical protein